MEILDVYLHEQHIGTLSSDKGRMSFVYLPEYLAQGRVEPLSYSLPLRSEAYGESEVMAFFSNLLPDESVRERVARLLQLSPSNTFGLLKAIGEDCAGAIAFFTPGKQPLRLSAPEYRVLTEAEANDILTHLRERPLDVGEKDFRISGAGAQEKLVACVEKGKVVLPLNGTPSTHIIKPELKQFPGSVANEYFCMKLASACGLDAAKCDILTIAGKKYYVTLRYDRSFFDGHWQRLHQEDFCQLLGYAPKVKYESEGGPKLLQCFELFHKLELPMAESLAFLERILFCFLIGNGDAHAKNFSILYQDGHPHLAPVYDFLSTAIYSELTPKMAMKIDGEYNFRWITKGKILRMCAKAGIPEKVALDSLNALIKRMSKKMPRLVEKLSKEHPSEVYAKIAADTFARIQQLEQEYGGHLATTETR